MHSLLLIFTRQGSHKPPVVKAWFTMTTLFDNQNMQSTQYLKPSVFPPDIQSENLESLFATPAQTDSLLNNLDAGDLKELRNYFFPEEEEYALETRRIKHISDYEGISLTKDDFVHAIHEIFGKGHLDLAAANYFEELQQNHVIRDTINWEQFLESIIANYKKKRKTTDSGIEDVVTYKNEYTLYHNKDPISIILPLETETTFCYVIVHYFGNMSVCSSDMVVHHYYDIPLISGLKKRNRWISSVTYSSKGTTIFIATSDRYLFVYDTTRLIHSLKFVISGFPNVISCQTYSDFRTQDKSMLILGDESGNIHTLIFHQPAKSFFQESQDKETSYYHWKEIKKQVKWVSLITDNKVHKDYVMEIKYIFENDTILSCSQDPTTAIVIKQREGNKLTHVTRMKKSLKCFDFDRALGFLATSTSDPFIYLWNCSTPGSPIIKLDGHEKNVVDICFLRHKQAVLSLSEDGVLKIWHVEKFNCIQTIRMDCTFPRGKVYFRPRIIFKRGININYKIDCSTSESSQHLVKDPVTTNIFVVNDNVVTMYEVAIESELPDEKPVPEKTLNPLIPKLDVLYKNYNREHPLSLKRLYGDLEQVIKTVQEEESPIFDNKFFLRNGAVHLGLKLWDIDETFIRSTSSNILEI